MPDNDGEEGAVGGKKSLGIDEYRKTVDDADQQLEGALKQRHIMCEDRLAGILSLSQLHKLLFTPVSGGLMRSLVILLVILYSLPGTGNAEALANKLSPPGKWKTAVSRSEMANTESLVLSLISETPLSGSVGGTFPTLYIRCMDDNLELYVDTRILLDGNIDNESGVRINLDDNFQSNDIWNLSTDGKILFCPEPKNFIMNKLIRARYLKFGFMTFDKSSFFAIFDVSGLESHLNKFNRLCPISK